MSARIQLKEKKKFLKWFMKNYPMKRRESMWILNYLLNHDIVLNKTHFVEYAGETPRGIKIVSREVEHDSFRFYKDGIESQDPEKAFHEIRLNWHSDLYVELVFPNPYAHLPFVNIVEDNPYARWNDMMNEEFERYIDNALDYFQLSSAKQALIDEIDTSLLENDSASFYRLTQVLKEIDHELDSLSHK